MAIRRLIRRPRLKAFPCRWGGYKGSGLAVMVEILCAALSGGAMLTNVGGIRVKSIPMRASHLFLAIDVARFLPIEEFAERMHWLRETITHSRSAAGFEEVMIAGDPEWRTEEKRRAAGIPVARGIWEQLTLLAGRLHVAVPGPII